MAIRKTRKISELPLFLGLVRLNTELFPVYRNMRKDIKFTYGQKIINIVSDIIIQMQYSYETEDINKKLETVNNLIFNIDSVLLLLKILVETREISNKKYAFLTLILNDIRTQATSWKHFIDKKLSDENKVNAK